MLIKIEKVKNLVVANKSAAEQSLDDHSSKPSSFLQKNLQVVQEDEGDEAEN